MVEWNDGIWQTGIMEQKGKINLYGHKMYRM